jgi:deoxyadenosine/deoxycytidine kinase
MYIVEGNIGAGKSTFLSLVAKHAPYISVILEPLHHWQRQAHGQSLLTNFMHNPRRWSYTMETLTMMCRVKDHLQEQSNPHPCRIMERSIYSGHYVFALTGYESGFMTEIEWQMYRQWYEFLIPSKCRAPHGFIYLKSDPKVAYERVVSRSREGENEITLDYLRMLDSKHDDFLIHKKNVFPDLAKTPVLTLDVSQDFEHDVNRFKELLFQIEEFMYSHSPMIKSVNQQTTASKV